jgi:hypothetical protein
VAAQAPSPRATFRPGAGWSGVEIARTGN